MNKTPHHTLLEDFQALLTGSLLVAFAVVLFRQAGLLTGGTPGLTFLAYYASGLPFGVLYFLINIPFYIFGYLAIGKAFTVKTFVAVLMLSLFSELMPRWISIAYIDPFFAAILAGLLAGAGLLILIRHQASLGGVGVLAIYLQKKRGWRAGHLQMMADGLIVCGAFFLVDPLRVALSILGVVVLNLVLAVNHRPGRYFSQ
jgi:uncharacterized membrane-anchored protein YitT (DUF2179 family)